MESLMGKPVNPGTKAVAFEAVERALGVLCDLRDSPQVW